MNQFIQNSGKQSRFYSNHAHDDSKKKSNLKTVGTFCDIFNFSMFLTSTWFGSNLKQFVLPSNCVTLVTGSRGSRAVLFIDYWVCLL